MDAKKSKTIFKLFAALLAAVVSLQMMSVPVYAATTWSLEGWRVDSTIWIKGNHFTWYKGENVPMRLKATGFEAIGQTIAVTHDYQDADGAIGIDEAFGWFIGPIVPDTTPIENVPVLFSPGSETFTISGPALIDTPKLNKGR